MAPSPENLGKLSLSKASASTRRSRSLSPIMGRSRNIFPRPAGPVNRPCIHYNSSLGCSYGPLCRFQHIDLPVQPFPLPIARVNQLRATAPPPLPPALQVAPVPRPLRQQALPITPGLLKWVSNAHALVANTTFPDVLRIDIMQEISNETGLSLLADVLACAPAPNAPVPVIRLWYNGLALPLLRLLTSSAIADLENVQGCVERLHTAIYGRDGRLGVRFYNGVVSCLAGLHQVDLGEEGMLKDMAVIIAALEKMLGYKCSRKVVTGMGSVVAMLGNMLVGVREQGDECREMLQRVLVVLTAV